MLKNPEAEAAVNELKSAAQAIRELKVLCKLPRAQTEGTCWF